MASPGTPPLITVFGGGGFIGRYVCEALLKTGARLRVAERDPRKAWFLQPLGGVGQVSAIAADLARPATIDRGGRGRGCGHQPRRRLQRQPRRDSCRRRAPGRRRRRRATGAKAFVHVSAIGADPESPSDYGRTKGLGEQAVRKAFPRATLIRPSIVFGPEDEFTNRFAVDGALPHPARDRARRRASSRFTSATSAERSPPAALDPKAHGGKTYELAGPEVMTMRRAERADRRVGGRGSRNWSTCPISSPAAMAMLGFLPGAPLTRDQWLMLQKDNVADGGAAGFKAFGIAPTPLAAAAPEWLGRFKKGGRFAPRATA